MGILHLIKSIVSYCLVKVHLEILRPLIILSPMELGSIIHFLQDKTILVTGATGFLAKSLSIYLFIYLSHDTKLYLVTMCFLVCFCSFCGKNIEGSTKCEETLPSFESQRYWICYSTFTCWGECTKIYNFIKFLFSVIKNLEYIISKPNLPILIGYV